MPVLLFPDVAYFLVKAYRPYKNPLTGRVTYEHCGRKWTSCNLHDPVQREHAHNYYLSLCPDVSQEDRDKVASEWADIRHAREAEEKKREEMKLAEKKKQEAIKERETMKMHEEKKKREEKKMHEEKKKREEEKKREEKERIDAMLEESEGVAMNIAKVEKAVKTAEGKKAGGWMGVVMG